MESFPLMQSLKIKQTEDMKFELKGCDEKLHLSLIGFYFVSWFVLLICVCNINIIIMSVFVLPPTVV